MKKIMDIIAKNAPYIYLAMFLWALFTQDVFLLISAFGFMVIYYLAEIRSVLIKLDTTQVGNPICEKTKP